MLDMVLQKNKGCGNCGNWWFGNGTEKDDKWKCGTMISLMVQNCDRSSVLKAVIEIFWYRSGETLENIRTSVYSLFCCLRNLTARLAQLYFAPFTIL